jgi:hypothetical protein
MRSKGKGSLYGGEQRRARHGKDLDVVMNEASEVDIETKTRAAQESPMRDVTDDK